MLRVKEKNAKIIIMFCMKITRTHMLIILVCVVYVYKYTHTCKCIYMCMKKYTYIYIYIYIYIYVYTHTHIYVQVLQEVVVPYQMVSKSAIDGWLSGCSAGCECVCVVGE